MLGGVDLLSPEKLLLLALLIALVFGAKTLPGIARRAGKGIHDTRQALGIEDVHDQLGELRATLTGPDSTTPPAESTTKPPG